MPPPVAPSYLPEQLADIWLRAYIDAGGNESPVTAGTYALRVMRGIETPPEGFTLSREAIASIYDTHFKGNRRSDGTFRFDELGYVIETEEMRDTLRSFGFEPAAWESRFPDLIGGDVSSGEFEERVRLGYQEIIDRAPEIAEFYRSEFGLTGLEPEDIIAAFIDPGIGEEILAGRTRVALVGGSARQQGFQIAASFAQTLLDQGLDTFDEAQQFFGTAQEQIPLFNVLAQRHFDPDDDFDIFEFTAASLFNDPVQRRRMARLIAQERTQFEETGPFARDQQTGSLTGLEVR